MPTQHVVLKFQYGRRGSANPIISQTMGRVAVLNFAYTGPSPQPGSFWLCQMDYERQTNPGGSGCFVVTPLCRVEMEQIVKLVPGMFQAQPEGNKILIIPKLKNHFCIAPFAIKRKYIKKEKAKILYNAVVVPLDLDADFISACIAKNSDVTGR
jgi:hypothetical protein